MSNSNETMGTLFIKDVVKVDNAIFDPSLGVVGQSWHLDVTLWGTLDPNGFVFDFSELKSLIKTTTKGTIDHALLLPVGSQLVHFSETADGEQWHLKSKGRQQQGSFDWDYRCPKGAVYPIRAVGITPAIIEQECGRLLRHRLPASIHKISVKLRDEAAESAAAFFRYTHGVTGHNGLCQRLFHGHRSRIEIVVGDERRPDLEHYVARELLGGIVHIACPSQVIEGTVELGTRGKVGQTVRLRYSGSLGSYEALLPAERVFMVGPDTSIECIAQTLIDVLVKSEGLSDSIKLTIYEGIDKGSIAER